MARAPAVEAGRAGSRWLPTTATHYAVEASLVTHDTLRPFSLLSSHFFTRFLVYVIESTVYVFAI